METNAAFGKDIIYTIYVKSMFDTGNGDNATNHDFIVRSEGWNLHCLLLNLLRLFQHAHLEPDCF